MRTCFAVDAADDEERSIFLPPPSGDVICTKNPADVLVMARVLPFVRELHAIVMLRDPRDAVVSVHARDPGRYWMNLRMWREYHHAAMSLRGHPRVVTVRYEDLVCAPAATQSMIGCSLPFLAASSRFEEFHLTARPSFQSRQALGAVRPPDVASIGRWRTHRSRLAGQLRMHGTIARELIELGYERDAAWVHELDGVTPDTTPSHWPEHRSWPRRARRRARLFVQVARLAARRAVDDIRRRGRRPDG
jgi:hypothetical protein